MALFDTSDALDITDIVCKQIMAASMSAVQAASHLMGQFYESYRAGSGPLQRQLLEICKDHQIQVFDLAIDRAARVSDALIEFYGRDDRHKARLRKWAADTNGGTTGAKLWEQYDAAWRETHEENPNLN